MRCKNITVFGKEIKKALIDKDMTQRELAREINVNENYLTDIINGRRSGAKYKNKIIETLFSKGSN